jgi:hypothetical protein
MHLLSIAIVTGGAMRFIKEKIIWMSVLALSAAPLLSPNPGFAQHKQEAHSGQAAAPNSQQRNNGGDNSGRSRNNPNGANWSNGNRLNDLNSMNSGRWNNSGRRNNGNEHTGNWNNLRPNQSQRSDRDRENDRDRNRRDRNRNSCRFGLYWGGTPYSSYYQGFYNDAPYGYSYSSPHDAGYSDGMNAGQFDRIQGNLYNPRQYERSTDPDYFQGFVDGYEDGFRR